MSANDDGLTWTGIAARFLFALLLVYATWNPMGASFVHWVVVPMFSGVPADVTVSAPIKFLLTIALIAGWVVYVQATRRSLGLMGALLVAAICGGIVWLLVSFGWVAMQGNVVAHIILVCIAIMLAVGMSWSHISRRMTGQMDTDTVE